MRRLKILLSAYACEPAKGSEPGVGWNMAREAARYHDTWVLTRANNRPVIEAELARNPIPNLHFVYYDLPGWAKWWKRGPRGVQLYYYLWQMGVYRAARRIHREVGIDLVHHVTFVSYWKPSLLSLLPAPFVWGPVGGGESSPRAFWKDFGFRGRAYEVSRAFARWLSEHDPLVRIAAHRSVLALATTDETAQRLSKLGVGNLRVFSQAGLSTEEIERLSRYERCERDHVRFVSIGRLLHWKGFHLGLRAFGAAGLPAAEYWIIGEGPERRRLQALAKKWGATDCVRFWGRLPREETLNRLGDCDVLIHPSLHDSGGLTCLEAMAAGLPAICLDTGGPATLVTKETGFKIPALHPEQAVRGLAEAMRLLAKNPERRASMGNAARKRVAEEFNWRTKGERLAELRRAVMT